MNSSNSFELEGFTPLTVVMDMTGHYKGSGLEFGDNARLDDIGMIPNSSNKGNHIVALKLTLADGTPVLTYTTWRLLHTAVRGLEARYGEPG